MVGPPPGGGLEIESDGRPGAPARLRTTHRIHLADGGDLGRLPAGSVELVVTSPPYPMIEMWDGSFGEQDEGIRQALSAGRGFEAFERMHRLLDRTWKEVHRVLVPGGIACINVGDAVRTIDGEFVLYPNHARILSSLMRLGLSPLPCILWRKQTNAPNKFMGSGMLPPGAYVTLEHEHVLIARKGRKRELLSEADRARRRESAFFWEERNAWYSDVWLDLKGTAQDLLDGEARERSGAFPFELPYRLISMFSIQGDTVLDPFLGTGTTAFAAMAAARNSVGFERDASLMKAIASRAKGIVDAANARIAARLDSHLWFVRKRSDERGRFGYRNRPYGFPVVTRQEVDLVFYRLVSVRPDGDSGFEAEHAFEPPAEDQGDWSAFLAAAGGEPPGPQSRRVTDPPNRQLNLLDVTGAE